LLLTWWASTRIELYSGITVSIENLDNRSSQAVWSEPLLGEPAYGENPAIEEKRVAVPVAQPFLTSTDFAGFGSKHQSGYEAGTRLRARDGIAG
jgi:hypothetical protein